MNVFAAQTHPGSREGPNEDSVGWDLAHQLWFVADGMGGYSHGQDASRLVKETLLAQAGQMDLTQAVLKAHESVREAASHLEGDQRMGSTVVCAQLSGDACRIVWVGDSRAYLWRKGELQRLTRDHSYVEALRESEPLSETQMRQHPNASVVLQTLGMGSPVPSEQTVPLRRGDWIMLCSDGVSVELRDSEIASILRASATPQQAVQAVVDAVLKKGARDNTSVEIVQHGGRPRHGLMERLAELSTATMSWIAALVGVMLAAAAVVVLWHLRSHR